MIGLNRTTSTRFFIDSPTMKELAMRQLYGASRWLIPTAINLNNLFTQQRVTHTIIRSKVVDQKISEKTSVYGRITKIRERGQLSFMYNLELLNQFL
jgi:hypothetical protein